MRYEGVQTYSSSLSLTLALDDGVGRLYPPPRLSGPRSLYHQYTLYRRMGGPQDKSQWVRKIKPTTGSEPRTAQPVGIFTAPTRLHESWKSNLTQPDILKSNTHLQVTFFHISCNTASLVQPRSPDLFQNIFRSLCSMHLFLTHTC